VTDSFFITTVCYVALAPMDIPLRSMLVGLIPLIAASTRVSKFTRRGCFALWLCQLHLV